MSRLEGRFHALRARGRTALVPYVTAGDPGPEVTVPLLHALVEAGADVVELGVPFSDPMADGPVIQRAGERALAAGMTVGGVLDLVAEFRRHDADTPVVLMGYLNPIEAMGYQTFATRASVAGVDGLITVDLPPEEASELLPALEAAQIDPIFLLAPTTTPERIAHICRHARGFVYYVSLKGVTGSAALDTDAVAAKVEEIRRYTGLPVGVGFGIRDGDSAARVGRVSDAVVVGTAMVRRVEELADRPGEIPAGVAALVAEMRAALDAA